MGAAAKRRFLTHWACMPCISWKPDGAALRALSGRLFLEADSISPLPLPDITNQRSIRAPKREMSAGLRRVSSAFPSHTLVGIDPLACNPHPGERGDIHFCSRFGMRSAPTCCCSTHVGSPPTAHGARLAHPDAQRLSDGDMPVSRLRLKVHLPGSA